MFYIDFTTPEGKTYRIDMSKNPVTYECPVCGEKTIYPFDPTAELCCWSDSCFRSWEEKTNERARKAALEHIWKLEHYYEEYISNPKLAPNVTRIEKPNYRPSKRKQ